MIACVCRLAPYHAQQVVTRLDTDGCVLDLDDLGSIGDLGCSVNATVVKVVNAGEVADEVGAAAFVDLAEVVETGDVASSATSSRITVLPSLPQPLESGANTSGAVATNVAC
jgi:hypothetical protein